MLFYFILTAILCKQLYNFFHSDKYDTFIDKVKPIVLKFGYNIVYFYSTIQIIVNKLISFVNPSIYILSKTLTHLLIEHNFISKPKNSFTTIDIYKNGQLVNQLAFNEPIYNQPFNVNYPLIAKDNCDLTIVKDKQEHQELINVIHYTTFPECFNNYKHSNIKFLSMELTENNNTYTIDLNAKNNNYYIVDNIFNANFFKYYLINELNVNINTTNFVYKLSIIDHNANFLNLTQNEYLILKDNDFEIHKQCNENICNTDNKVAVMKPISETDCVVPTIDNTNK